MKRRILCLMASLLLCGAVSAQNWGTPDPYAQPSNTPIVASVGTLGGVAATITDNCRLGAFVGDELRGIAAPQIDGKFWIQVFYTATTDNITFKFYNGTTEYATCATTLTGSDAGYGTPNSPVVLDFTNGVEQTVELAAGWNWWSTNVETTLADLKAALVNADGNSGIKILAGDRKSVSYNGSSWRGSLTSLDVTQMYKIQTTIDCELELSGNPINPEQTITITPGYNWIGFPYNEEKTVSSVFSGFAASGDRIMSGNTNSTSFNGTTWRGRLTILEPGQGYIYYSNDSENRTFTFPSNSK